MNIFVAKLDYSIQDSDLRQLFEEFGEVDSAKVIMDRMTGRSKGFGFVEMSDDSAAEAAIAELNDAEVKGRPIVVKKARPREDNNRGGFDRGGRGGYGGGRDRY